MHPMTMMALADECREEAQAGVAAERASSLGLEHRRRRSNHPWTRRAADEFVRRLRVVPRLRARFS